MTAYQGKHAFRPLVTADRVPRRRSALGLTITAAAVAASLTTMVVTVNAAPSGADTHAASAQHLVRSTPAQAARANSTARSDSMIAVSDTHVHIRPATVSQPHAGVHAVVVDAATSPIQDASVDVSPLAASGIPVTALHAYQDAAEAMATTDPQCGIPWPLLAGIGRVESDHGRFAGATLYTNGTSSAKILGPVLDGKGTAVIRDTDGGLLDGNTTYDRAMGPLQFIPSTWFAYASDGNGDGIADPFNIFDASLAAAKYLCAAGGNLATTAGQVRAVFAYNHLNSYVRTVLGLEHVYADGAGVVVPDPPAASKTTTKAKTPTTAKTPVKKPVTTKPVTTKPIAKTPGPKSGAPSHPAPPVVSSPAPPPVTTPTAPVSTAPTAPVTTPPTTLTCPPGTQPIPVTSGSSAPAPASSTGSTPATTGTLTAPGAPTTTSHTPLIPGTTTPIPVGCELDPVPAPTSTG